MPIIEFAVSYFRRPICNIDKSFITVIELTFFNYRPFLMIGMYNIGTILKNTPLKKQRTFFTIALIGYKTIKIGYQAIGYITFFCFYKFFILIIISHFWRSAAEGTVIHD